jgi:hypothetical protein
MERKQFNVIEIIRGKDTYAFPALLVVLVITVLAAIEISHPYFFCQDDNRTLYLPMYVHNLRSVLGGELPFYNFHQYLGTPVTIQYAAWYPVNYAALMLSKMLLGNYFCGMDIIAVFHLIIAALGFYCLMRSFDLQEASCFFGAVAWTFCGFVVTVGNSWIQTIGFAAYLPWILLFSIQQTYRFDIRYFFVLVALKVCDLLLGYPQLFVYTVTFEFLTVVVLYSANAKQRTDSPGNIDAETGLARSPSLFRVLLNLVINYAFVFIVTLPLIVQTMHQAGESASRKNPLSWEMYAAFSYDLSSWVNGLIAPFRSPALATQFEFDFISHIGYVTLLFVLIALLNVNTGTRYRQSLGFALLALLSLLWAHDVLITKLLYQVPFFNRLRFPFKVAFFSSFFLIVVSTFGFDLVYDKILRLKTVSRRALQLGTIVVLAAHTANFLVLYAALPQKMFSRHMDPVPINEPLKDALSDGRIVSAGLDVVFAGDKIIPGYSAALLGHDYATLWGLYQFGGYDPMVPDRNQVAALGIQNNPVFNLPADEPFTIPSETLEYFRNWGVKWYVVDRAIPLGDDSVLKLAYSDARRNVLRDMQAKPVVYWGNGPTKVGTIVYRFRTNAIEVDYTGESAGPLVINVLQNPFFSARLDGNAIPIAATGINQVVVSVPEGRHRVVLKYTDLNFIYASVVSALFVLLTIVLLWFGRTRAYFMKCMS